MAIKTKRIEELLAALGRMSRREKFMVGGLVSALVIFVTLVVSWWVSSSLEARERRIADKTSKVQAIVDLRQQYEEAKEAQRRSQELMRSGANVQLLGTLEAAAKQLGVSIGNMKSSSPAVEAEKHMVEEKVEVDIPLITIDRLVDLLQEIERKSKTIAVRKLRVQQSFREPNQLEVAFTVSNFRLMEEEKAAPSSGAPAGGASPKPAPTTPTPPGK